jgi:ankyrin repeat protein
MSDYKEVKMLLGCDGDSAVLERNFRGQTALHLAIRNPKMLRCLVDGSGTNSVDTEDHDGTTPFMYSAAYNEGESAILLLNSGAKLNKFDKLNGLSFIGYAMFRNNYNIIQTLIDRFRRVGSVLLAQSVLDACLWGYMYNDLFRMVDIEMKGLQYLVREGGNINVVSERGNTLLHFSQNSHEAALLLSKTGNPINQ